MIVWALEALVSATLLMMLVLALRGGAARAFGAEWAYALWALPVLVPLLPPIPLVADAAPTFTVVLPAIPVAAAAEAAAPASAGADWLLWLLAIWAGGAAVFAFWQQSTYSAFMLHLGRDGRRADPPSYGGIKVVESDAVEGPVAIGLIDRRIVVPIDFMSRYNAAERRLALEHELVHHRRLDILWNWVGLAVLTANWFNPIAHIAFRAFRSDQELSCDAAVTRRAPAERHHYACALVKAASEPGLVAACPLNRADFLKRRLRMMKQHRSSRARTMGGLASIVLVGGAAMAIGGPGFAHEEQVLAPLVATASGPRPMLAAADLSTLREKCGTGGATMVCSQRQASDPAVRAIMKKSAKKAAARAKSKPSALAAMAARPPSPTAAIEPDLSDAAAPIEAPVAAFDRLAHVARHVERMARTEEAMARARTRLAAIRDRQNLLTAAFARRHRPAHLTPELLAAIELARSSRPLRLVKVQLSAEQTEALRTEAGSEGQHFEIIMTAADAEVHSVRLQPPAMIH